MQIPQARDGLLRSSRQLWAVGGAIVLLILVGCGVLIWDMRRQALEDQSVAVSGLGVALAEQTTRYFQLVDFVLREVQSRADALDLQSPKSLIEHFATDAMRQHLRERLTDLPQANAFFVLGSDGHTLVSSRLSGAEGQDFSDRDYFRHFVERDEAGIFVSQPIPSRVVGTPAIYVARRINNAAHEFLGVVVGAVDLQYLTDFYRTMNLPSGETVTLLRNDGLFLVRHPMDHGLDRMPAAAPWHRVVANGGGRYRSDGFLTGMPALISVHPLPGWPLVIDTAIQEPLVLANWRRQAVVIGLAGLVGAGGFALLFGVIGAQFGRQALQTAWLTNSAEALRTSEARLRDFVEMASDWLWEQDAELRFTWLSATSPSRYAKDDDYVGQTRWGLIGADATVPPWPAHIADLQARRPFRNLRYERLGRDGRMYSVSISGNPVFDPTGQFLGYRGTGRDVTAEVQAEAALLQAKDRAEAASRVKSEFLANMSHELRTPLNAIIGFSELIRDQPFGKIGSKYADYATDINAAGRHLLDLINDVLDLSKIEAGRYALVEEVVDLVALVRICMGILRLRAREGEVTILDRVGRAHLGVWGDQRALKQIVLNLLGNAVKFTPAGGTVSIGLGEAPNEGIALVVADTGIGIDPAVVESLCEPFAQADASIVRRYGGSGLGLAISQRLLAMHGGNLEIESAPGQGTAIRIMLPASRLMEVPAQLSA